VRDEAKVRRDRFEADDTSLIEAAVRSTLGSSTFERLSAAGRAPTIEQAIAPARPQARASDAAPLSTRAVAYLAHNGPRRHRERARWHRAGNQRPSPGRRVAVPPHTISARNHVTACEGASMATSRRASERSLDVRLEQAATRLDRIVAKARHACDDADRDVHRQIDALRGRHAETRTLARKLRRRTTPVGTRTMQSASDPWTTST
jgi:hypothetical protein